jgi:O-antigen ligase
LVAYSLCALLAVRYWQRALFGVFVLLVFEGALRKWAFPWAQGGIYLLKDAILLAIYIGFLLDGRLNQPALRDAGLIKVVLILSFVFGCIEVLNPNSPSILVGLAGLKTYFLYAPVAFILPYAIKSREQLFDLIRRYLIMAIPVAVLGFVQIVAGPESSLNAYVSHSEDVEAVGVRFGSAYDLVRTSGTFSYISGYAVFLSFVAFLAIGYNMARGWRLKNNIAPLLALILVVGAMFTTGSRGPVYTLLLTGPIILGMAIAGRVLPSRTVMRVFVLLPVIAIVAVNLSPQAFEGFAYRATTGDTTLERVSSPVYQTIEVLSEAPALGMGIGTTHSSALAIMGTDEPWWLDGIRPEDEMARVTAELGVIGLLLNFFLRCLIAAFGLRCAMSFRDRAYRALGIVLAVHLALGILVAIINNATAGLYYWGGLGLVLAMRQLEQSARTEARTTLAASRPRIDRLAVHAE